MNAKSKNSKKPKRQPYKKTYMLVQQLKSYDYNWTSTENKGLYNDNTIIKLSKKFQDSGSVGYSVESPYHYIYEVYQRYYWPILNEYRHSFNDYKWIFNSRLNVRAKAKLILLHLGMRIEFFSFNDWRRNGKHSRSKRRKFLPIKMAGILHNSDKSINGRIVAPHIHIAIKLGKQATPDQLSKWSGISPQYFESTKGGRYAFNNELAYLTHEKQPRKFHYNHKNVWSNRPIFDYQRYYQNHAEQWERYRATKSKQNAYGGKDWLEQLVKDGKITFQEMLSNTRLYNIYTTDIQNIKNLFQARADRVAILTRQELEERKFGLSVIYICGKSGSGKTTEADKIVDRLRKHYGWACYHTIPTHGLSSHPFDRYNGEPIIYWDEARSTDLSASEWLQLLDPRHENSLDARYTPKRMAAKVIVITTIDPPEQFFGFMNGIHQDEPLTQFMRRLGIILRVKVTGGRRQLWLDPIINRGREQRVYIGDSDKTGNPIYKYSQYVEVPIPKHTVTPQQATDKVLGFIAKNNNPKLPHNPGHHETIPATPPKHYWHLANSQCTVCYAGDNTDKRLAKEFSGKILVENKRDDGSCSLYVKGSNSLPF